MFTLGYRGSDLLSFKISLNNPSRLAELQELEHWKTKFDIASAATEGYFSKRWVSENLFNLPSEEMIRIQRELYHDKKFESSLELAIASGASGGADDLGGGIPDLDAGLDLDAPVTPDEPADTPELDAPAAEEPEPGALLATPDAPPPPAKRDDNMTVSKKGRSHESGPNKNSIGRRKVSYRRKATPEVGQRNTNRSKIPETFPGKRELDRTGTGIYENLDSTYKEEEQNLFEINYEIQSLINQLEDNGKN